LGVSILNKILREVRLLSDSLLSEIPGILGCHLRYSIYKKRFRTCGKKVYILQGVSIKGFKNIEFGDEVCISPHSCIFAESKSNDSSIKIGNRVGLNCNVMINADIGGEITIESNVLVGPNVVMRASGHRYKDINIPIRDQGHQEGKIVIKEDVWIGANAVILPNVVVGKGAVVGAGAVVTKDVADFDIVGGVPAIKIGSRKSNV